jgi:hypothetical protein
MIRYGVIGIPRQYNTNRIGLDTVLLYVKCTLCESRYEVKLKLICAVSPEIMNKLERCKSLLSGKHPRGYLWKH